MAATQCNWEEAYATLAVPNPSCMMSLHIVQCCTGGGVRDRRGAETSASRTDGLRAYSLTKALMKTAVGSVASSLHCLG